MEVVAPNPNEFELTLLGPGYGECVEIHHGHGEWIVVDSCVDHAGDAAALSYVVAHNPFSYRPAETSPLAAFDVDVAPLLQRMADTW